MNYGNIGAAFKEIGRSELQNTDQCLNNICESSHLPFRLKESSMQKFKKGIRLQLFASIPFQIYNHFNHQRQLQG